MGASMTLWTVSQVISVACSNSFQVQKVLHHPGCQFLQPYVLLSASLISLFHTRLLTQLSSFQLALPPVPFASNSLYLLWFSSRSPPRPPPLTHSDLCLTGTPQDASHSILHFGCFFFLYNIFLFLIFYLELLYVTVLPSNVTSWGRDFVSLVYQCTCGT